MEEGWPGPCGVIREEGGVVNSLWNTPAVPLHSPTPTLAISEAAPLNPYLAPTPTFPLEQGRSGKIRTVFSHHFNLTSGYLLQHSLSMPFRSIPSLDFSSTGTAPQLDVLPNFSTCSLPLPQGFQQAPLMIPHSLSSKLYPTHGSHNDPTANNYRQTLPPQERTRTWNHHCSSALGNLVGTSPLPFCP